MAMLTIIQAAIFLLLICPSLFSGDQGRATSLSFFYKFSDPASFSQDNLYFEGDAYVGDGSVILANGEGQLAGSNTLRAGRVSFRRPIRLWSNVTGKVTDFSATFSFVINSSGQRQNDTGGGLAFFMAPYKSRMPVNSGGGYLGLFNSSTATGGEQIVAVELDNHGDVEWDPTTSPHIGVDLNTLPSGKSQNRYKIVDNLADGVQKVMQVDYNGVTKALVIVLGDFRNDNSVTLKTIVDLRMFLPQQVAMGFSAARGVSESELHRVLWWSFNDNPSQAVLPMAAPVRAALEESANTSAPPPNSGTRRRKAQKWKIPLAVVGSLIGVALLAVIAVVFCFLRCLCGEMFKPDNHPVRSGNGF